MKCRFAPLIRARLVSFPCALNLLRRVAPLVALLIGAGKVLGFNVEVEPNNTAPTATSLPLPSGFGALSASIKPPSDLDYFRFIAPAGSKAWILVDTGGTNGLNKDSFLTLLASNGITVLEEDDDDGTGNGCDATEESGLASAIAGSVLMEGGTYYASIRTFDGESQIDPYNLLVALTTSAATAESEPNATPAQATPLLTLSTPLASRAGTLAQAADVDVYSVAALAGTTLFVSADCDPERNGGTDLILDLIATNRTTVILTANSSLAQVGAAEAFCFTIPLTGTYYIRVRSGNNATGSYEVMAATRGAGTFQFTETSYSLLESDGSITVPIVRLGGSLGQVSVLCVSSNGTASAGSDYTAVTQMLTFPDGIVTQFVSVTIAQDLLTESNETILLTLKNPTGGANLANPTTATLLIVDDDEPDNNSAATATPLDLSIGFTLVQTAPTGQPLVISPGGDQDWYSFKAPPGATLWALVDTGGPQNSEANSRDCHLSLFAPDGTTLLEEDDDDGSGSGTSLTFPPDGGTDSAIAGRLLLRGGVYYLRVKAFSAAGIISPYRLFIIVTTATPPSEGEPNNAPGFANALVTESSATAQRLAQISPAADLDYYTLTLASNSLIYVSLDCDPERDGVSTDLVVDLLSTDGLTSLFSADSSGGETNAAESFCVRVPATGTYFLRVQHVSLSSTGTYRLMASRQPESIEPNNNPGTAGQLEILNQFVSITREISPAGDNDYYTFVATPGSRIWLTADTGGPQQPGSTSRDIALTLLDSDGTTVIEFDDNDGTGNACDASIETEDAAAIAGRTLVAGGNYYLKVAAANGTGVIVPYRLFGIVTTTASTPEAEPNNAPNQANSLLEPAPAVRLRSGAIGTAGDVDVYALVVWEGNIIHVSVDCDPERDGVSTDLRLELLSPAGDTVILSANSSGSGSGADPAAEAFCFLVPTAGTYYIRLAHASGATGSYLLMAARDTTPLRITSVSRVGMDALVKFPSEFGRKYVVEYMNDLNPPRVWTALGNVDGNGQMMTILDQGGGTQVFRSYQVRLLP